MARFLCKITYEEEIEAEDEKQAAKKFLEDFDPMQDLSVDEVDVDMI